MTNDMYSVSIKELLMPFIFLIGMFFLISIMLFLFLLGPLGWIIIFLLVVGLIFAKRWWKESESAAKPQPVNCPSCGAPNAADADVCGHCDARIE